MASNLTGMHFKSTEFERRKTVPWNRDWWGKAVAVLTAHEFEDIEVMYTVLQLSQEGADVVVGTLPQTAIGHFHGRPAWPEKPITGRFGHTIPFDVLAVGNRYTVQSIWEMNPEEFDAAVFPGGLAPDFLRIDDKTLEFAAAIHRSGESPCCHLSRAAGSDLA